jgi:hypothetical protein
MEECIGFVVTACYLTEALDVGGSGRIRSR